MFSKIEYLTSEMMGPPETLAIESSGRAIYESHTNMAANGDVPVGTFETKLPSGEIDALAAALGSPPFASLPDHSGRIVPGERYSTIRVTGAAGVMDKHVGTGKPVDPALHRLRGLLDRIVAEVRQHPLDSLVMTLDPSNPDLQGVVRATITLRNTGSRPAICADPSALQPGSRLILRALPDREASQIHSTDVIQADVTDIVALRTSVAGTAKEVLQIGPGEAVSFRCTVQLALPQHVPYVVQAIFRNTAGQLSGQAPMIFDLYSPPARVPNSTTGRSP
jgi:hypothetical protein